MYVCVHTYMYVCTLCMHLGMYILIYAHMYVHRYVHCMYALCICLVNRTNTFKQDIYTWTYSSTDPILPEVIII